MSKNRFLAAFERDPTSVDTLLGEIQTLLYVEGALFPLQAIMVNREHDRASVWTLDGHNCEDSSFDLRIVPGVGGADWCDYAWLIDRVAMINREAAAYLRGPATKLEGFLPGGRLDECFEWLDTPQGAHFWGEVFDELERRK